MQIKLKFEPETVKQVRLDMFKKDIWLKNPSKISDTKCRNCGREYKNLNSDIALIAIPGQTNKHVCFDCGSKYISMGAQDIKAKIDTNASIKDNLIKKIRKLGNYNENSYYSKKLDDIKIPDLEVIYTKKKEEKTETDRIAAIVLPDIPMEDYLSKDYNVIENINYLKCVEQIENFFEHDYDYFDCGQGYYQEESTVICKIGEKFYDVTLYAEIGSSKQDRGDRLYYVESIETVTWKEIPKPQPKVNETFIYKFTLNKDQKSALDSYLKGNNFDHCVK